MTWSIKKLGEVLEKTPKIPGVLTENYLDGGQYPIIDQGQSFVGGYTNSTASVYSGALPVIVFGDHTRAIKFIDFPFAIGADGTKILKPSDEFEPKYFYYFLQSADIPARGYTRHFRLLRELEIPVPPVGEQRKIVARIEKQFAKIDEAARLRAESQAIAAQLFPAALREIFENGKAAYEMEELGNVAKLVRGPFGGSLKKEIFVDSGDCVYEQGNVIDNDLANFRYFITPKKFEEMRRFEVSAGDILMSCSGTIGKFVIIPKDFKKGIINQALLKITPNKKVAVDFLKYALIDYLSLSNSHVKGMAIKNIAAVKELKKFKIPLPPLTEQKKIIKNLDALSEKVRALQELQSAQSADLKALKQSILHQAFTPQLAQ